MLDAIIEATCTGAFVYGVFMGPVHIADAIRWFRGGQ